MLSRAGDSELTRSANLQRGKPLGGNHQFKVLDALQFWEAYASQEASGCFIWAVCQRQCKQDPEAQGFYAVTKVLLLPGLSRHSHSPQSAHILLSRPCECVPLCGKKDSAGETELRVLRQEMTQVGPVSLRGSSWERGRRIRVRGRDATEAGAGVMCFKDRGQDPELRVWEGTPEAGKGSTRCPLEPPEGPQPCPHLDGHPVHQVWTSTSRL